MAPAIPEGYEDLLDRPLVGVLATVDTNGIPNATPMWFKWENGLLRFTHTKKRRKVANLLANRNFSFVITDPDNPYRYLECRGVLHYIEEDPSGAYYIVLGKRYGNENQEAPEDSADRVIINLDITRFFKK